MHWLQLFITHTHTRSYKITKEKLRYFDIMGANLSLGKPVNDIPWHGKLVTLEFLRKHWSAEIDSFKIEPVMAETREGVFKEDGGGASGPSIIRLRLTWSDGKFTDEHPESCVLKTEDNLKDPAFPMITRLLMQACQFIMVEMQANEANWYAINHKIAVDKGYSMPKTYCAVRSHHKIKVPSGRQFVMRDSRQNFRTCIIMEDMKDYKSPPQQANLSKDRIAAALNNFAILHASYWGKQSDFDWIDGSKNRLCTWLRNLQITVDPSMSPFFKGKLNLYKDNTLRDATKAHSSALGNELWTKYCGKNWLSDPKTQEALAYFINVMQNDEVRNRVLFPPVEIQTINHGDCHGWNHMFLRDDIKDNAGLAKVKSVDFGFVGGGRPTWDLIYFFAMSVDGSNFQADMDALRLYYDALCEHSKDNS